MSANQAPLRGLSRSSDDINGKGIVVAGVAKTDVVAGLARKPPRCRPTINDDLL